MNRRNITWPTERIDINNIGIKSKRQKQKEIKQEINEQKYCMANEKERISIMAERADIS